MWDDWRRLRIISGASSQGDGDSPAETASQADPPPSHIQEPRNRIFSNFGLCSSFWERNLSEEPGVKNRGFTAATSRKQHPTETRGF